MIRTKFMRPTLPATCISRERLLDLFKLNHLRMATLVAAPPGFGKTTLAVHAADLLERNGFRIAWLALDANDDSPDTFFHSFRTVLSDPSLSGRDVGTFSAVGAEIGTAALLLDCALADLAASDDPVALFVDDVHLLSDPEIIRLIDLLLRHPPGNFHMVMLGRSLPPLMLDSLRLHNQLTIIDASSLSFTADETQELFVRMQVRGRDFGDLNRVHDIARGWPAAVRTMASALLASPPGQRTQLLEGGSRTIDDLFRALSQSLPEDLRADLEAIAVPAAVCEPLAAELIGSKRAERIIVELERNQVYSSRLEIEGDWLVLHDLLRTHLIRQLRQREDGRFEELGAKAALWLESANRLQDAVRCAMETRNAALSCDIAARHGRRLLASGELLLLRGWAREFDGRNIIPCDLVKLVFAWSQALSSDWEMAREQCDRIASTAPSVQAELRILRALLAMYRDEHAVCLELLQSVELEATSDPWLHGTLANLKRQANIVACRWDEIGPERDAQGCSPAERHLATFVCELALDGMAAKLRGNVIEARQLLEHSLALARQEPGGLLAAIPAGMMADVHVHLGDLGAAENLLAEHRTSIPVMGNSDSVRDAIVADLRVLAHAGRLEDADAMVAFWRPIVVQRRWRRVEVALLVEAVCLALRFGQRAKAFSLANEVGRLASGIRPTLGSSANWIVADSMLCQLWIATEFNGTPDRTLLEAEVHHLKSRGLTLAAVRMEVAYAQLLDQQGETDAAIERYLTALRTCVAASAPGALFQQPYFRPSLYNAARMAPDMIRLRRLSPELLVPFDALADRWTGRHPANAPNLSSREREVLRLLADGRTNKEIAILLGLSPETVKTYLKRLFAKLGIERRAAAATRARELALIDG